jgi:ribosomal-protein-alanine N-acetyltransferase
VHIRPATLADIPSILDLERQSATAGHWTEEQYRRAFRQEGGERLVLLAEDSPPTASAQETRSLADTRIFGFLVAQHLAPEWELENIVVAPAARRQGLGKRLLDALLAAARETNSTTVFLEVRESNAAARSLYEKAGFEQTGRRKAYYTNPVEDALLYRLTLP